MTWDCLITSYDKKLTETLLAVDICDLGVFQTKFGNASITNIYLPASFGNA